MVCEHMSWCARQHADGQDCEFVREIDGLEVAIVGAPCDSARVETAGQLSRLDADGVQQVINLLVEFQALLITSRGEVECSAHDHSDD